MLNLKRNDTNEIYKTETDTGVENKTYGYSGEGIIREFRMEMYKLLYLK